MCTQKSPVMIEGCFHQRGTTCPLMWLIRIPSTAQKSQLYARVSISMRRCDITLITYGLPVELAQSDPYMKISIRALWFLASSVALASISHNEAET